MKKSLVRYFAPILALGVMAFMMVAFNSAFTPTPVQKQKVVLYKFNKNVSQAEMEKHLVDYKALKRVSPEIVGYSAGYTFQSEEIQNEFDVMHHLTFKTDKDIETFMTSDEYKAFVKEHSHLWEKVMVVNSEIE